MNDSASLLAKQARAYYEELLRPVFAGRKFLIIGPIAVGLRGLARQLTRLGAERPFLIAANEGTGDLPPPDEAELRVLGIQDKDPIKEFHRLHGAIRNLPADLRSDIDAWDPSGTARFIFPSPLTETFDVAGREAYAARPHGWAAFEDKVNIDAFWDAVGVSRAPSRIVPAEYQALKSTAATLDRGLGTVWAADAREGTHGGGLGIRWVRHGAHGSGSFASLRRMADRIRVMPFLEGIPASIHGVVFPDSVAVFRPAEMVVLRPLASDRLHFAGCSTAFDPRPDDRIAMRDLAYRVGVALRETVGYRGPFGIDGILADEGYLPTELNARGGTALGRMAEAACLPLAPLCLAVSQGERLDYRPDLLEQAILKFADARRICTGWSVTSRRFEETRIFNIRRDGNEYREARMGEQPDGTLEVGPNSAGGFVRFVLNPERIEEGPSAAQEVLRAFRFSDRALETDFGPNEVASNARP